MEEGKNIQLAEDAPKKTAKQEKDPNSKREEPRELQNTPPQIRVLSLIKSRGERQGSRKRTPAIDRSPPGTSTKKPPPAKRVRPSTGGEGKGKSFSERSRASYYTRLV